MLIKNITVEKIENIAHRLAIKTMDWDEPIPKFETRYPNILESCVRVPFQKFNNKYLYKDLVDKAAILFYLMIKNHPFQNGNKRLAMTTLFVFLYLNEQWIEVDKTIFYNFAVWVAGSSVDYKEEVVKAIEKFVKKYMIDLK